MRTSAIAVAGLRKSFGDKVVLDGIDLEVPAGTVFSLLGPNGAGKTTTIRMLATLLRPDAGEAQVLGYDVVRDARAVRSRVGLTGQFASVDEDLTGVENLLLLARLLGYSRRRGRERAADLLDAFGLAEAADRQVKKYSGGMRRRIDIAASLVVTPELIFLDEPTTGLDPRSRLQLWETIEARVAAGTTVLLTTQYLDEADRLADRIAVIDRGRVIADGTADELKERVGGLRVEVHLTDASRAADAAMALAPMSEEQPAVDDARVSVRVAREQGTIMEAARRLDQAGIDADDVAVRRPTLDDVFLTLTGRSLRDAESGEQPSGGADDPGADNHTDQPGRVASAPSDVAEGALQ